MSDDPTHWATARFKAYKIRFTYSRLFVGNQSRARLRCPETSAFLHTPPLQQGLDGYRGPMASAFGSASGVPGLAGPVATLFGGLVSIPARGGPQAIRSGLEEISETQAAFMSPFNVVTSRSPATRSNWLRSSSSLSVRERRSSASRICCCTGPPLGPDSSTLLVSTQPDAALDRLRRPRDTICALPGLPWAMARARSSHHSKARIRPS